MRRNRGGQGLTVVEAPITLTDGFVTATSANQAAGPYFAILRVRTSPLEDSPCREDTVVDAELTINGPDAPIRVRRPARRGRHPGARRAPHPRLTARPRDRPGSGKRRHAPIMVVKEVDRTSPLLLHAWVRNDVLPSWRLDVFVTDQLGRRRAAFTIELRNAYVVEMSLTTHDGPACRGRHCRSRTRRSRGPGPTAGPRRPTTGSPQHERPHLGSTVGLRADGVGVVARQVRGLPAVNQIKLHPYFTQAEVERFGAEYGT